MKIPCSLLVFVILIISLLFIKFSHAASSISTIIASFPSGQQPHWVAVKGWTTAMDHQRCRIWARTNCNFDGSGRGGCQTGDCNGILQCTSYGAPPNTLAEYALNQFNNQDFFDISLIDGFNVPMEFTPTSGGCTRGIMFRFDNNAEWPNELRAPGGCNNACTVFKTDQYCCPNGGCQPTDYSRFFKDRCRDA